MKFVPNGAGKFRFWCQKVLPLVYDDSLSYYEVLNKVVNYLNRTREDLAYFINHWSNPVVVDDYNDFVDPNSIYLYTGDQLGYNQYHWYYYDEDTNSWKDGGLYGSAVVDDELDDESVNAVQNKVVTREINYRTYYVTPQMFGGVGDGLHDDTDALKEAMTYDNVFIPEGTYMIRDTIPVHANTIIGNNALINFNPYSWRKDVFAFYSDDTITVSGVNIDCRYFASIGFYVHMNYNTGVLDHVIFDRCKAINTNNLVEAVTSGGIVVDRKHKYSCINGCEVSNINRNSANPGIIASVGIHVGEILERCYIANNSVSEIHFDSVNKTDADGIQAYQSSDAVDAVSILIENNTLNNCQGRFIKLQCENGELFGNTMVNKNIEIMPSFTSVDCQTGKGTLLDNTVTLVNCTGGESRIHVKASGTNLANRYVYGIIKGNKFFCDTAVPYVIQCTGYSAKDSSFIITGNVINGAVNCVLLTANAALVNRMDAIIQENALYNYTRAYLVQSVIEADINLHILCSNNAGANESPFGAFETVTVPSTITNRQDILKFVGDALLGAQGAGVVQIIWSGHESTYAIYGVYGSSAYQITWFRNDRIYTQVKSGSNYYTYEFDSVATLPQPTI